MSTRYTNCDIEVHMTSAVEGMDTTGIDEDASNARARQLVTDALMDAYPESTVHVHMDYHTYGGGLTVHAYPDDANPDEIVEVANRALEDYDAWIVETSEHV